MSMDNGTDSKSQPSQCPLSDPTQLESRPSESFSEGLPRPAEIPSFKRHPEFWLDDGNLILVANDNTAFRIYAGLLASQSHIFEDMFAVAGLSADEVFDGCPVVRVYDTSGEFAHFLRVLIPKQSRRCVCHHPPPSLSLSL